MIQIRRATTTQRNASTDKLEIGRPLFDTNKNALYIGDGETSINQLSPVGHKLSTGTSNGITVSNRNDDATDPVVNLSLALANNGGLVISSSKLSLNATTANRNAKAYDVHIDNNNKLFVNVPWVNTDTDTNIESGTGINVTGTTHNYTINLKPASYDDIGGIRLVINNNETPYDATKVIKFVTTP